MMLVMTLTKKKNLVEFDVCESTYVPGVKAREKAVPWPPSPRILWPLATKLFETFGKYVSKCLIALKSLAGVVGNTCRNSEVDSMMTTTDSGSYR
jgi:hypothetical protein